MLDLRAFGDSLIFVVSLVYSHMAMRPPKVQRLDHCWCYYFIMMMCA